MPNPPCTSPRKPSPACTIDFTKCCTGTVRDFGKDSAPAAFRVDVYGLTCADLYIIGDPLIGSAPFRHAVKRLGLDPNRYQATILDVREQDAVEPCAEVQKRRSAGAQERRHLPRAPTQGAYPGDLNVPKT